MTDPSFYITMAGTALAGLTILAYATLTGWRGWLALKQQELQHQPGDRSAPAMPSASARIEIADLKERIRKLEAIAAGVDL
ncbi:hypothetical protein PX554_14485 [Sphingomonas sp. H39-1-10]|uniref:hypothetical protein n=1 Tax=Sphingomonas TaxID=13687 RepID=UPI0008865521|nr:MULTISPECIES: hypothetical protein [Sphingomonas]MDF0489341.1 hypothetical protein [Sphingomonas pollutisoli]SDA29963.1 hypothetical protein SAMN03159340_02451 [Sphingomonas sp. NFR15]